MSDEPSYILDVEGLREGAPQGTYGNMGAAPNGERAWIGIQFECCSVYTRIYRNSAGTGYEGACPRCGRPVRIRIGPGGTSHRMFRAT